MQCEQIGNVVLAAVDINILWANLSLTKKKKKKPTELQSTCACSDKNKTLHRHFLCS